ncbi:hypothetical protein SBD_2837 [Streptomyces bottropensis ATCC 25435]|uniref:Uncharacterized protein n=1 Tax=Streptomyces bottropensis ATCC 25435 TaxID=1054862 RepID=M3FTF5_9ACTN|nr:hypothetical protein SBD_2837 [Streptomyces bottropensis ATCC 25435]
MARPRGHELPVKAGRFAGHGLGWEVTHTDEPILTGGTNAAQVMA